MARGASQRGVLIAFGDNNRIIWDQHSAQIFRNNPNIAQPGSERLGKDLEWIKFHRGHRVYNHQEGGRWKWNYDFHAIPGEVFLSRNEKAFAERPGTGSGFVLIEPNVPVHKSVALNKQWPTARYDEVARQLKASGVDVVQFKHSRSGHRIPVARQIHTEDFRTALAVMKKASLYIGAEGGLHHGAAAVKLPAVVLFGGFIPPQVTGYDTHLNLTGGAEACGSLLTCTHCKEAMARISVEEVVNAARGFL